VLYSLLLPLMALDLWVTAFQWICFPMYGVPCVSRRRFWVLDRHKLAYLNGIEKANCVFCGYGNGVISYVREVAACTEQYWCPIRHATSIASPHDRYTCSWFTATPKDTVSSWRCGGGRCTGTQNRATGPITHPFRGTVTRRARHGVTD